ncbi:MAG: response regulator [Deltaproteobacteria bacterium]|nr:MAG: response regulator [Deltaproteobacteria bacterium]
MEKRILIIDDDDNVRKILQVQLEKAGYITNEAKDAEATYKILEEYLFEVVICDIKNVGGIKILEYIKEKYETLPVIMLTGYVDINTAVEVMKKGAVDYLTKPIKKDEFLISLERAIQHKKLLEEEEEVRKTMSREFEEAVKESIERASELEQAYYYLKQANFDMVKALSGAIEAKDPFTKGHSYRVSQLSLEIARKLTFLNLSGEQLEILERGALLHDIGKIGVKDAILNKTSRLTGKEYSHVKRHPVIGEEIIRPIEIFHPALPLIRSHHEYFNGGGYPDGLKGREISIFARVIAVPDAFDAMTSDRPYRKALTVEDALSEIKRGRGSQFDPQIVDIFIGDNIYDRYMI